MKNMIHARLQGLYINDATRTNVVTQIGTLMKYQSEGHQIMQETLWGTILTAFMEVNEIDQENLQTIVQDIINDQTAPIAQARVFSAQVRPMFADRERTAMAVRLPQG